MKLKTANQTLLMFDHDGTLCDTNENAYDSIKFATLSAVSTFNKNLTVNNIDWGHIFSETLGTTEKNFVQVAANMMSIPLSMHNLFEERFYISRKNWYQNMINLKEYVWDTYYPDAEKLLNDTEKEERANIIKYLVTGNPIHVLEERIPKHIRMHFNSKENQLQGTFGNEALSRKELITKCVQKAIESYKFRPIKNKNGIISNAYYIADSKNDFYAGIEAKVKTIWIPSRSLQNTISESNTQELKLFRQLMPESFITTNNLSSEEVYNFIGINEQK